MMRAPRVLAAAFAVAGLSGVPATAEVQRVASDGTVYRVDVESVPTPGKPGASRLQWTRQSPTGGKVVSVITGTDDAAQERDPALEIEPGTGRPVVVWARYDYGGYNLYVSRFDGTWSTPKQLVKLDGDDLDPQIHITHRYLHLSWRQQTGVLATYWRASFYAGSVQLAYGPERIPTDDVVSIPLDGGPEVDGDVSADDRYFSATVPGRAMADPVRNYIWGVRDEPVPIGYRQSFVLPPEARAHLGQRAEFIAGRLTVWVATADKVYYTTLADGTWEPIRVIELSAQTSVSDARLLIEERNRRLEGGGL